MPHTHFTINFPNFQYLKYYLINFIYINQNFQIKTMKVNDIH